MFVFYKLHCSFRVNAFTFLLWWRNLAEVETLWTVGASNTHITPKWVINLMQSHSTGVGAIMIKLIETCKNKQLWVRHYYLMENKVTAKLISVYWYFCFVLFLECSKNKNTGLLRSFQSSIVSGYAWGYLSSINAITFYGLK